MQNFQMPSNIVPTSSQLPVFFDLASLRSLTMPSLSTETQAMTGMLETDSQVLTESETLALSGQLDRFCPLSPPMEGPAAMTLPPEEVFHQSPAPPFGRAGDPVPPRREASPSTGIILETPVKQRRSKPTRWFPCQYPGCTKKFNRFGLLLRHEGSRAHMSLKPFECHCGQRFSRSDNWGDSCHRDEKAANEATKRRFDLVHEDINRRNELRKQEMTLKADLMAKSDDSSDPACALPAAVPEVHPPSNILASGSGAIPIHPPMAALPSPVRHSACGNTHPTLDSAVQSTPAWNPSVPSSLYSLASLPSASQGTQWHQPFPTYNFKDSWPSVPRPPPRYEKYPAAATSQLHHGYTPMGGSSPALSYGTLASPVSIGSRAPACRPMASYANPSMAPLGADAYWSPSPASAPKSSCEAEMWPTSSMIQGFEKWVPCKVRGEMQEAHRMMGLSTNSTLVSTSHRPSFLLPQSHQLGKPTLVEAQLVSGCSQEPSQPPLSKENIAPCREEKDFESLLDLVIRTCPIGSSKRVYDSMQGSESCSYGSPLKRMAWGNGIGE